jgi:hypothetical protein
LRPPSDPNRPDPLTERRRLASESAWSPWQWLAACVGSLLVAFFVVAFWLLTLAVEGTDGCANPGADCGNSGQSVVWPIVELLLVAIAVISFVKFVRSLRRRS